MTAIDKLLKFLNTPNVASLLDDDQLKQIADDVITGYKIDDESRSTWLERNQEAVKIIKHCEEGLENREMSKVIYPLLAPAVIQLSSRLAQHIVRNGQVLEVAVLGDDTPLIDYQTGQPLPGKFVKQDKAKRITDYASYEFLKDSDTWLLEQQKLCSVVSSWGTAFTHCYYDPITKKDCFDLIPPEDVIINHNITSLEKAPRITVRHYLSKNDIISNIRAGYFLDLDIDDLDGSNNDGQQNEFQEISPVYEFLCQLCYIDLDDDDYAEPYHVYVLNKSHKVFGIVPAFEFKDIRITEDGKNKIQYIKPRFNVIDYHCIDDPEGKFYSLGLNYLLLHPNRAITTVLRQLLDSGTLANQQGGFVTKAFKTKERTIQYENGVFQVLDCNPNIQDPSKHIMPFPFKEPSQVLFALMGVLIDSGKSMGFITDTLTGDAAMQNVPATTMLAMIEQGTRAFKPMVQKFQCSQKKMFKWWFHSKAQHLDEEKYIRFNDNQFAIVKDDFDEDSLDVIPVADPTQSSEGHKYAQVQAMIQLLQQAPQLFNGPEMALRIVTGFQFNEPEKLVAPPQQQQPDPKMLELQLKTQQFQAGQQKDARQSQLDQQDMAIKQLLAQIKSLEAKIKVDESGEKQMKMKADAMKDQAEASIKHRMVDITQQQANTDERRVDILARDSNKKST